MKDYNKISKPIKNNKEEKVVEEMKDITLETNNVEDSPVEEIKEEKTVEKIIPSNKSAIVVNCKALNIRKEPSTESKVIGVINENDRVSTFEDVKDFTKILTSKGIEGYCMTQYLEEV